MRSGVIVAALITTNGPLLRADAAWRERAASSLPVPGAPVISTRALVGATRSIWLLKLVDHGRTADDPLRLPGFGAEFLDLAAEARGFQRALCATSTSRSALNGFSMKS